MPSSAALERIRRVCLVSALWSALLMALILVGQIWNDFEGLFSKYDGGPTSLAKMLITAYVVFEIATGVLLTLLIASHVKKTD